MFGLRSRFSSAALVGLVLAIGLSGTVSAEEIITDTGTHGDFVVLDSPDLPGAKCGYSPANSNGDAFLRWMRVRGPSAQATDSTPAVDHQQVSFQVKLQRQVGTSPWKTVASSAKQTRTAYDNAWADFSAIRVYWNGDFNQNYRAITVLRWLRNGSVKGLVKARIQYYSVKWTVGIPTYVFTDACTGQAD